MERFGLNAVPEVSVYVWVQSDWLGHVTRELNLLRALEEIAGADTDAVFFTDGHPAIDQQIAREGYTIRHLPNDLDGAVAAMREVLEREKPGLFILDSVSYDRHPDAKTLFAPAGVISLAVYDHPEFRETGATLTLNALPNLAGNSPGREDVLSGIQYFVLDPEFHRYHERPRVSAPRATRGFAFFGGGDPSDFAHVFLGAVEASGGITWTLLVGPMYAARKNIEAMIVEKNLPVRVETRIESVAQTLFEGDLALVAAGNTLVEAAAVGMPCLAVCHNSFQATNANYFAKTCGVINMGERNEFDVRSLRDSIEDLAANETLRGQMSRTMKRKVDGLGARRVAEKLWALYRQEKSKGIASS